MSFGSQATKAQQVIKQVFDSRFTITFFALSLENTYKIKLIQDDIRYNNISVFFETETTGYLLILDGKIAIKYHFEFLPSLCFIKKVTFRQYEEEMTDIMVKF